MMLNRNNSNRKLATIFIGINLALALLLFIFKTFNNESTISIEAYIGVNGIVSLVALCLFIWQHYRISKNVFNYNIIFIIFVYLFTFGQIVLYSVGVPTKLLSVFRLSSLTDINWASEFALFCFLFFQIGTLLPYLKVIKNNEKEQKVDKVNNSGVLASIRIVAILLFLISAVPYIIWLIERLSISINYGYGAIYEQESGSNIIGYIVKLFIPSVFMLLYSVENKRTKWFLKGLLLLIVVLNLIVGSRGGALTIVTILIVYNYTFEKKINKKSFLKIIAVILAAMIIIPTIASFRGTASKDAQGFSDAINTAFADPENSFMVKTISELGYSIHPIILTKQLVPSVEGYHYGESYISDFLMIIPSFLMGGYSFAPKAALDIWLQDSLNMSYGPGYSLFAETYYNFGEVFGILFSLVLGYFFALLFDMDRRFSNNKIIPIFTLIFLYNSAIIIRFPMHATIRNLVYMYAIPYLLIKIIYERRYKKYEGIN